MTSKSLSYKSSLIADGFKRHTWLIAIYSVILFFALPVTALLKAQNILRSYELTDASLFSSISGSVMNTFVNSGLKFFAVPAAILAAASMFYYINSKKQIDFYHSLPISRTRMFFNNVIIGFLSFTLPYLIMSSIAAGAYFLNRLGAYFSAGAFFASLGVNILTFSVTFALSLFAFMLCGNIIVGLLGLGVFTFYGPALVGIIYAYFEVFFSTYYSNMADTATIAFNSSPIFSMLAFEFSAPRVACYIVLAVVLLALSLLLYQKRGSEAAGKAIAFKIAKPIIKYPLVFLSTCVLALMFRAMGNSSVGWTIFGFLCGAFLSHAIIEIIYDFDFKSLRKNLKPLLIFCGVFAVFYVCFEVDLIGFDKYLPNGANVSSAYIRIYLDEIYNSSDMFWVDRYYTRNSKMIERLEFTTPDEIATVLAIAGEGIEALDDNLEYSYRDSVGIAYKLKNGRMVYRQYTIAKNKLDPYIYKLYNSDRFKNGYFDLIYLKNHQIESDYQYSSLNCTFLNTNRVETINDAEQIKNISDAVCRDIMTTSAEYLTDNHPVFTLAFKLQEQEDSTDKTHRSTFMVYMPVYESSSETLALLREYGIEIEKGFAPIDVSTLKNLEIYAGGITMKITSEQQAAEIAPYLITRKSVECRLFDTRSNYKYYISSYADSDKDGDEYSYSSTRDSRYSCDYYFKDDTPPNFVAAYFLNHAGDNLNQEAPDIPIDVPLGYGKEIVY